jgi:hypothetical protein
MSDIVYTVTVSFTGEQLVPAWLAWMNGGHVADVIAGGATAAEIVRLDLPEPTFDVHYRFPTREAFTTYERDHAPRLRADGLRRFPVEKGIMYKRTVGEVVRSFP